MSTSSSGPTPAQVHSWNNEEAPLTWTRTAYNTYLCFDKGQAVYKAFVDGKGDLCMTLFLLTAVPLAKQTGSKTIKNVTILVAEGASLSINPTGWVALKVAHLATDSVVKMVLPYFPHPEVKDMVTIGGDLIAVRLAKPLEESLNEIYLGMQKTYRIAQEYFSQPKQPTELQQPITVTDPLREVERVQAAEELRAEQQLLVDLEHKHATLLAKNNEVERLPSDPEELANNAYNLAEQVGLKGNADQIALEGSKQINAFSITGAELDRNSDSIKNAQLSSKHNRHRETKERIKESLLIVRAENAAALQASAQRLEQQRQRVESVQARCSELNIHVEPPSGPTPTLESPRKPKEFASQEEVSQWITDTYDKAKITAEHSGARDMRLAIAKEVARQVSFALGLSQIDEGLIHEYLVAMDKSDRRWRNDVLGEMYRHLTGVKTDQFEYARHGLMRIYRNITKPIKDALNFISQNQEGDALPIGANVGTNGEVGVRIMDRTILVHEGSNSPTPLSFSLNQSSVNHEGTSSHSSQASVNDQAASSSQSSSNIQGSTVYTSSSMNSQSIGAGTSQTITQQTSRLSSSSQFIPNLQAGVEFISTAQKGWMGYSPFGMVAKTLGLMSEMAKNGFKQGLINFSAEGVLLGPLIRWPALGTLIGVSKVYHANVPRELIDQEFGTLRTFADGLDSNDFGQRLAQNDIREGTRHAEVADSTLRTIAGAFNWLSQIVKFKA